MKKAKGTLTPLRDIIANILAGSDLPFNPEDAALWKVWDQAVGAAIASHAKPLWIKNGQLRIEVSDPIWLQELRFMEQTIREKLNGELGRKAVEKIDFRLRTH